MVIASLRKAAREIWEAALDAASPATCLSRAVELHDDVLRVNETEFKLDGRLIVIGAGKAAARMGQVMEDLCGDRIASGLLVTKYDHALPLRRLELIEAGHPLPDTNGIAATRKIRELLQELTPKDVVVCLISGGGSALWPAPADGVTLEQKQEVTSTLLRAGATIQELNAVRKHLSAMKGGQLARWAFPASVISLIMSDVIGDPLDSIASGPTTPDTTTFADALGIIRKYAVEVPQGVLGRFEAGARGDLPDTPKPGDPVFDRVHNAIVANNRLLIDAASAKARELGFNTAILGTEVEGEAKEVGRFWAAIAREIGLSGSPVAPPACILAAGETTVTVRGKGSGGRNQEMALAWAMAMAARPSRIPCCFASVATDGTDGPTDAAGGLVDPSTCARAVALGLKPLDYLQANDSCNFLKQTGDLIVTGPTQTNLMDLQILLADNG
jgi:hydroxypyruvate reductase